MASFISTLALFILVLSNGCFTLPVHNETLFSSTEQNTFGLQGTSTDETNVWKTQHSSTPFNTLLDNGKREFQNSFPSTTDMNEHGQSGKREFQEPFSTSTHVTDDGENNDKREFQESFSTSTQSLDDGKREFQDSFPSTTESVDNDKREFQDSFSTSTQSLDDGKREFQESFSSTTESLDDGKREFQDSFPSTTESVDNDKREFQESFPSTSTQSLDDGKREFQDSFPSTTESADNGKREFNDDLLLTTTEEPIENNVAGTTGSENLKREIEVESTTNDMLLFELTSSSVAPQLYTSESSTVTRKYIGNLPLENDENEEHKSEEPEAEPEVTTKRPFKPKKVVKKVTEEPELESTDNVTYENEVQENLKESTLRTAVQDQKALDGIQYSGNFIMELDTDATMVVTDISKQFSTSPKKFSKSSKQFSKSSKEILTTEMPLNQGTESSYPEAEEQNN